MPSLHEAAEVLAGASSLRGASLVAARLGFSDPLPLDADVRARLGIADQPSRAYVADGAGGLRCCIVMAPPGQQARQIAATCASRLGGRSSHVLWLVIVAQPATRTLILALPPAAGSRRVTALVVDARTVQPSDAETLAAMTDAVTPGDVLTHQRWREILGRDALTRRFYREMESAVNDLAASARGPAPEAARRELALLCTSRLLFLAFLEAKGWMDGDREYLRNRFDAQCARGGNVHRRLLDPLFFGTLNTPVAKRAPAARALGRIPFLNGGLFARTHIERRWRAVTLTDDGIGTVICGLIGRYRVTAREETVSWSEAAVDPEMLGRAFESLMASDDRRRSGAFFTPLPLIERVTTAGIDEWLSSCGISAAAREAARDGNPIPAAEREQMLAQIASIRVLDPACGSGAFLVHALERLSGLRMAAGDPRPVAAVRREVLERSIFGVDINPMAVWLCELRLWLSVVIDSPERDGTGVAPLPNLDHHARAGDALAGPAFDSSGMCAGTPDISRLRRRYARATGTRKKALARRLDGAERRAALDVVAHELDLLAARRRDLLVALRGRDLFQKRLSADPAQRAALEALRTAVRGARRRQSVLRAGGALPFSFLTHFADAGARGGFDIVLGNPPWVRVHRISGTARADFASRFRSWREAAWAPGARDAGTGRGFASQVDLATLFVERATQLVRPDGAISLLVPAKLWTSLSTGGIRHLLLDTCTVRALEDWSESPAAFDAVVYPSLLLATRRPAAAAKRDSTRSDAAGRVQCAIHRRNATLNWPCPATALSLDDSAGSPWLIVPPDVRRAFQLLSDRGVALSESPIGRPLLGVKTGCNDAFVVVPRPGWRDVHAAQHSALPVGTGTCVVRNAEREGEIEAPMLRPVVRGETVRAWHAVESDSAIIWTHGSDGRALDRLPPLTDAWLAPWRKRLTSRSDARDTRRYWSLFRTESADSRRARVVWSDISRTPRATVLEPGDPAVPLNSCYVVATDTSDEALALAALLNSAPVAAWLCALAEPARGGYRRFLGWTLARLPMPPDWRRAVPVLAPVARAARAGDPPDARALAVVVARLYSLRLSRLEPLVTWFLR